MRLLGSSLLLYVPDVAKTCTNAPDWKESLDCMCWLEMVYVCRLKHEVQSNLIGLSDKVSDELKGTVHSEGSGNRTCAHNLNAASFYLCNCESSVIKSAYSVLRGYGAPG